MSTIACPECKSLNTRKRDSRNKSNAVWCENLIYEYTRRRYHCDDCGHRFTSYEYYVPDEMVGRKPQAKQQRAEYLLYKSIDRIAHAKGRKSKGKEAIQNG